MVNNPHYTAVIMMFDEVLACVEKNARHKAMRAALREFGVRGRLNDSQLDGLWGDYTGGITAESIIK